MAGAACQMLIDTPVSDSPAMRPEAPEIVQSCGFCDVFEPNPCGKGPQEHGNGIESRDDSRDAQAGGRRNPFYAAFRQNSSARAMSMPKAAPIMMPITDPFGKFLDPFVQQLGHLHPQSHGRGREFIAKKITFGSIKARLFFFRRR